MPAGVYLRCRASGPACRLMTGQALAQSAGGGPATERSRVTRTGRTSSRPRRRAHRQPDLFLTGKELLAHAPVPARAVDDVGHGDRHPLAPRALREPEDLAGVRLRCAADDRDPLPLARHGSADPPAVVDGTQEVRDGLREADAKELRGAPDGVYEADAVREVVATLAAEPGHLVGRRLGGRAVGPGAPVVRVEGALPAAEATVPARAGLGRFSGEPEAEVSVVERGRVYAARKVWHLVVLSRFAGLSGRCLRSGPTPPSWVSPFTIA